MPTGTWLTGSLRLPSRTTLRLESGATILGSRDPARYPIRRQMWEGRMVQGPDALVWAADAEDVSITGAETTYRLRPGYYPWLAVVTIQREKLPPIRDFALPFSLVQVSDWERAVAAWREQITPFRADLVKITTEDPDTQEAGQARAILQQLDTPDATAPSTPPGNTR